MSSLVATLKLDTRLQARSQLYAIGITVAVAFGLIGRFLFAEANAGRFLVGFYLLGLGSTTYIFGAAVVLGEKTEGTLLALRATPLTARTYITSKVVTLTSFALVESVIVYALAFYGVTVNPAPLLLGLVGLGVTYTYVGLGQVARHDSVTSFLMPGAFIVGSTLQLPLFFLLDVGPPALWYAIPTQGPVLLMLGAFEPLQAWQWAYALAMTGASAAVGAWWARRRFARYVALQ